MSKLRTYRDAAAIVTGAASGIGRALAHGLAQHGADVVLADVQADAAEAEAAAIRAAGGRAQAVRLDVTDADAVARLVSDTAARAGRLDYVFNNAGIGVMGEARLHALADWRRVLEVNVMGVVHGVHAALPVMIGQGFGHIVNTASIGGHVPMPLGSSYSASKHAVVGLTESVGIEVARHGVRLTALCPGVVRTPILMGGMYGKNLTAASEAQLRRGLWDRLFPIEADDLARRTLAALPRAGVVLIVPWWTKVLWWMQRFAPRLAYAAGERDYRRLLHQVPEIEQRGR